MKIEEGVLRVFQRCLKGIKGFKEVSKVVQASFRAALRVFDGNSKEAKRCFKNSNDVS